MTWVSALTPPEKFGQYIIYAPSADPHRPLMAAIYYAPGEGWLNIVKVWRDAITHWMPMPEPPHAD